MYHVVSVVCVPWFMCMQSSVGMKHPVFFVFCFAHIRSTGTYGNNVCMFLITNVSRVSLLVSWSLFVGALQTSEHKAVVRHHHIHKHNLPLTYIIQNGCCCCTAVLPRSSKGCREGKDDKGEAAVCVCWGVGDAEGREKQVNEKTNGVLQARSITLPVSLPISELLSVSTLLLLSCHSLRSSCPSLLFPLIPASLIFPLCFSWCPTSLPSPFPLSLLVSPCFPLIPSSRQPSCYHFLFFFLNSSGSY